MQKIYRKIFSSILLSFFLFLCPYVVNAASATTGLNGNSSVYIGNNIEVTLYIENVSGTKSGLAAFGGTINYDASKLELVSKTSLAPFTVDMEGNKMAGFGANTIKGYSNIMKFTFKSKALGSTSISYSGSKQPDLDNQNVEISGCSKTINITEPPSSNNNLSSLSVSIGNINFNKNTTSYSLSVDSSVTSVTISANSEDSGAKIYGTGNKSLNYGSNKFDIIVTAPSGVEKIYTININRQDNRSGNNNLSSLKVNGGELKPGFNKNTTKYSLSVPYAISNLSVDAKTEDSKAKVTVSGNNGLIAEETKDVIITVIAENGSKKNYTISVSRGKDPNKKLSDNNYLSHLNVNVGILSPVFNKDTTNYEVWLPYEIDKMNFDYGVEDTKYAITKFEGNDTLQPGVSNIYKIKVTAENGEEKIYTINVRRAKNPNESGSNNTYLKSIKLKNGKLIGTFNKDKHEYFYTGKKGFDIEKAIPEDENNAVSISKNKNTIHIIVTSSNGEYGVYTLRKKFIIINYLWYFIFFVLGSVFGFMLHIIIKKNDNKNTKKKKGMKN